MNKDKIIKVKSSAADFLEFTLHADSGEFVEVRYENDTLWLTQKGLAILFDVEIPTTNYHLKQIFEQQELDES